MHEMGIVEALINQCESQAKANKAKKVLKIYIKIGVLSGVEIHFLQSAYDVFKLGTICEDASLDILKQDVVVKCKKCNQTSTLKEFEFLCPKCNSNELDVIDGEDMMLMKLEMI